MEIAVIGIIVAAIGGVAGLITLYFRIFRQEKREQERHAIELARVEERQEERQARLRQEEAEREAARQRAAAGTLDVSLNFYHEMGAACFIKVIATNSRTTADSITGVQLVQPAKSDWRVLVPASAPGVPITPQAWQQWTHFFPLAVPAGGTLGFWISGYVPLGIREHQSEGVLGTMFEFRVLAQSGEKTIQAPLERRPAP